MRINNNPETYRQPNNPFPKLTNHAGLTGMCVNGLDPSDYKTVSISDNTRNELISLARSEFVENYGLSDGENYNALLQQALKDIPPSERISTVKTLQQVYLNEAKRINSLVKETYPGWQEGKKFDKDAVSRLISGNLDVTV